MREYQLDILTDAGGQAERLSVRRFTARTTRGAVRKARRLTRANVADKATQYGEMYRRPVTGGLSVTYVATIEL